jgi:metal-responsive CopG/Arc/MetJ family transcriptional regulator
MRTKKKISVTIDAEIFEAIEKAAKTRKIAKSQLAQEAFRMWLKKKTEESMAEGYVEMAKENREYADTALNAQKEILS